MIICLGIFSISSLTIPAQAANPVDTFSTIVTAKTIQDFTNPLPSVKLFFDTYGETMKKFKTQLVTFYVGSGDHIYSYPANAFTSVTPSTLPMITGTLPQFDPVTAGFNNGALVSMSQDDSYDSLPGIKVTLTDPVNGRQITAKNLFADGQGISLHSFPVIRWNWKKVGGSTIVLQVHVRNLRTGEKDWIGYYAGAHLPEFNNTNWAQFYLGPLPTQWTSETINLKQDLDLWSLAPNHHDYEKDDWEVMGIALGVLDGNYALFNNIRSQSSVGINWDRFCGNAPCWPNTLSPNMPLEQIGRDYPQELTYSELKSIFKTYKDEAAARGFTNFKILDGVDAGQEFSGQEWKFYRHPEVVKFDPLANGKRVLSFQSSLNADSYSYAYPDYQHGIPQGTVVYDFIANQIGQYVNDMNIDGIYSTNDFGLENQWYPFGENLNCTPSTNLSHPCQGFNQSDADMFVTFLKNIKQKMGLNKYHLWMDTYLPVSVNYNYFSIPESAYDYIDYLQSSTFFQDTTGKPALAPFVWSDSKPFPGGPNAGKTFTMSDTIQSEIDLKLRHPNLKVLWTFYYFDPWYSPGGNQSALNFTYWNQYKSSLDGALIYSSTYKGELMNTNWLTSFSNTLPVPTAIPTITPTVTPILKLGDANGDGKVDLVDFGIWKNEYLGKLTTKLSDFNKSGVVDLGDFGVWKKAYLNL